MYDPKYPLDLCAKIDRLYHPFRYAEASDWEELFKMLPRTGPGRYWRSVLTELKKELEHESDEARAQAVAWRCPKTRRLRDADR